MQKNKKAEPSFFKWIRAARTEISRSTEGMTAEEYTAYIHARVEEARKIRKSPRNAKGPATSNIKVKSKMKIAAKS